MVFFLGFCLVVDGEISVGKNVPWFVIALRRKVFVFALICKKGKDVRNSTGDFGVLREQEGGGSAVTC